MNRMIVAALAALAVALPARAHFVFVVPVGPNQAVVVLSDDLEPDSAIQAKRLAKTQLTLRSAGAKDAALPTDTAEHSLKLAVPGSGPRMVFGTSDLGTMDRGKGFRLLYYPKVVFGGTDGKAATLGESVPVEIVPVTSGGKLRFEVLAKGKPVANDEVTVLLPGGESKKVKTGKDGLTPEFTASGRYGAWAKVIDPTPGKHDGKSYEAVRHYATLVYDLAAPALPSLPTAVSSLGAIACDGYLYIYGGHAGRTHKYDTKIVVGTFHRLKINGGTRWEELPAGPIMQGMNLAAHGGKIYRVGGMQPRNAPGEPSNNHSLTDVAQYDPKTSKWTALPPLPAGRSSHDVVVVGDKLVVVGGWQMKGKGEKSVWHETALVLDLVAKSPEWKSIPQPFQRRALTAAVSGSKVYVLGGLGTKKTDGRVDILDVKTGKWSSGPALPGTGGTGMAFSPAAATVGGRVVVNTAAGAVFRLATDGTHWEKVGEAARSRVVARLIPVDSTTVILIGGAARSGGAGNVAEVEVLKLAEKGEKVTADPTE